MRNVPPAEACENLLLAIFQRMTLTPDLLLHAYAQGLFPMANEHGDVYWYSPDPRAVIPLDERFHVSKNLKRTIRKGTFDITVDESFEEVIRECAAPAPGRTETWISEEIIGVYCDLHRLGHGHSLECRIDGTLVGGLYGVVVGGAFFGESMFSRISDASKVALVYLVNRLREGGFRMLDTQFVTDHLIGFGAYEIPRKTYIRQLAEALTVDAAW